MTTCYISWLKLNPWCCWSEEPCSYINAILVTHSEVSHLQVMQGLFSIEVRCKKISSSICIKSNLSLTFPLHRWGKPESIINYLSRVIAIDNKN